MPISEAVRSAIRKHAIKNAVDYGKADVGSVIGKVVQLAKGTPITEVKAEVQRAVGEVNAMGRDGLEAAYAPFREEFEQKAEETARKTAGPRIVIEGAVRGEVATRAPPEPGGYIHMGNIKQALLSDEIARIYGGKIFLFFDDTNPEKCRQEYVDGMKEDFAWLGIRFDKEYYSSDYIGTIYEKGRQLLRQGDAYVCLCPDADVKKNRADRKECAHRQRDPGGNLAMFDDMLKGKYDEGGAVVRLKGDMASDNATFRDPTLFRVKKAVHYRQGGKYTVWPTYHINTLIVDHINGVTDVVRGKQYEIWDEINKRMLKSLGIEPPRMHYEAMLNIVGTVTAKRVIRDLIKRNVVMGWDDPRLVTAVAMRRRGIQPAAIRAFVLRFGLSLTDSTVNIDMLLAENRKAIDPVAKHLFFVSDPVRITVGGAAATSARLKLHPSGDSGFREYQVKDVFYVSAGDAAAMGAGDTVRLKDLMDIRVVSKSEAGIAAERSAGASKGSRIIQWVSDGNFAECSVLVAGELFDAEGNLNPGSLKTASGYVESYASRLGEREIVQFERFGYCVLDDKKKMQFIFTSK